MPRSELRKSFASLFQRLRIPKAAPLAALRKARNSFSVKADFWGVNCRAAARGVLFARKKASLASVPDAACGEGCHAARGGAWGCRLRRRAGLLLAQAFATLRVAGFIALRRDRGRGVTFLLVQESNQRSTPKGATLTRRSPLWNPLLAARAVRNSTAALVALYNSRGSA